MELLDTLRQEVVTDDVTRVHPTSGGMHWARALTTMPILGLLAAAVVGFAVAEPRFLSLYNIANIAQQASTTGLMSIGFAFVLVGGGIDLSAPAVMALSAVLGATVMVASGSIVTGCAVMILVGLAAGVVNGVAVAHFRLVPFAVTLSTMILAGGLAVWATGATSIFGLPDRFAEMFTSHPAGVPTPTYVLIVIAIAAHFVLSSTGFGRSLYAVGTNRAAARICGIAVQRVELASYVTSGGLAGLAAILLTARLESAAAAMGGDTVMLDVISAAVIGGVSIRGGRGGVPGAALGALFVTVVSNGLSLLGLPYFGSLVVKGAIIVVAVFLDSRFGQSR